MNKNNKHGLVIFAVLLVVAAGCYIGWLCWEAGYIGSNPRAPVAKVMVDAVRKQALYNEMRSQPLDACLAVDIGYPTPEIKGVPGIAYQQVPGQFSITLFQQTRARDQPGRDLQLKQLDYLADKGLLSVSRSIGGGEDGLPGAVTYNLTWPGYASLQKSKSDSFCLFTGKRKFDSIVSIDKTLEKVMGYEVYQVTYLTRVEGVPEWAGSDEAAQVFPDLRKLIEDRRYVVRLIRGKDGWLAAYEAEMAVTMGANSRSAGSFLNELDSRVDFAAPSVDEVRELVDAAVADPRWVTRNGVACLPLQLQKGGDDKTARMARDAGSFTVTYYDRGDRKKYDYQAMSRALHILSALEAAGLARMEPVSPTAGVNEGAAGDNTSRRRENRVSGVRYHVSAEAIDALELGRNGGCVPAGRLNIELMRIRDVGVNADLLARGTVEQTPQWAEKIAERLPALRALIDTGLPLSWRMTPVPAVDGQDRQWRLASFSPVFPGISYTSLPAYLVPLMPRTVAIFPQPPVDAGVDDLQWVRTPVPTQGSVTGAVPPDSKAGPVNYRRIRLAGKQPGNRAPVAPPYPAGDSPVHVISVYQGRLPDARKRGFQEHPEGVIQVSVNEPDAVLLLYAYEPVEWRIKAARGIRLKQVIVSGIHEQRVTLSEGMEPRVDNTRYNKVASKLVSESGSIIPARPGANDLVDIASITSALTGVLPRSFQGAAQAPDFVVGPRTPRFQLPAPKSPARGAGVVNLRSASPDEVRGNRLLRGRSGPNTHAWASRAYSSGKVYFEGKMHVTGSIAAHTHANIGLCLLGSRSPNETLSISSGDQKLYVDGDLFGIAADFDRQRMYVRVNGQWVTGAPESGSGLLLEKRKEYRACAFSAGTTIGRVEKGAARSDTTWDVNFGAETFVNPVPPGYAAYQGG